MSSIKTFWRTVDPLYGMPGTTRSEFLSWQLQARLPQIRYVALLTTALYFIYILIEYQVSASHNVLRLVVHGALVPLSLLAVALLSLRSSLHGLMQLLLMAAPICAVAANLFFNSANADFAYYAPEIYLNLMWTFAVSGLTLRQAMLTASTSATLLLWVTLADSLQPGVQRLHLLWILASFSFGLLSAFLLEKAHKTMFLHQQGLALSAKVDGLTGLWNRSCTEQFFADEIARSDRYGTALSVILLDIDHFKQVNDTHGHGVGDSVLRQFATVLRSHVRSVDRVGRLGGEEFLIVLPEANCAQARSVALTLQQRLKEFEFERVTSKTASFGVTEYRSGESLQCMLERADCALYKAKENGRDRIEAL